MSEKHDECGIAAVYHLLDKNISTLIPRMLLDMQNRGQSAAGMSVYSRHAAQPLVTHKATGLVAEVFQTNHMAKYDALMQHLKGSAAIGHVRYVTQGDNRIQDAQPWERHHFKKRKWFTFAFNGNISNYETLKNDILTSDDVSLLGNTDTELIVHTISMLMAEFSPNDRIDHVVVLKKLHHVLDGAYSLAYLTANGEMVIARDSHGLKPLSYAFDGMLFAAASESAALNNIGFRHDQIRAVEPGQMLIVSQNGLHVETFAKTIKRSHCFFEWVYFANVASKIDERSVYLARKKLGEELARRETVPLDADAIVVPVPDTSKAAADAMAYSMGIPSQEGLIRNRYTGRTFIEGSDSRQAKAILKYTPLCEVLKDKRVFLVEDSIVRATTMRVLIERLRTVGGVREIHVRVTCPPIIAPCFYGIDIPTYDELIAAKYHRQRNCCLNHADVEILSPDLPLIEQAVTKEIKADSLRYLDFASVAAAIGFDKSDLCAGCVSGCYPTSEKS